jgi:hypothetical protein
MTQTIVVEIDESGVIRPVDPSIKLPPGRALMICAKEDGTFPILLPGDSFADWFTPEEDEAWAYLQTENQLEPTETKP